MPFRALKVRTRDYVVADDGVGADLDLQTRVWIWALGVARRARRTDGNRARPRS